MSRIYLARNVLDHQLLDADGRRCGKVDDLAIEGGAGESAVVVAILAGSGRLGRLAGWLGGSKRVSVPWAEVKCVSSAVELRRPAIHYGLAKVEDRLRPFVEKIPGADR